VFQQVTFYITVSDEQLNLRILDQGGVQSDWIINALTIQPAPTLPTEASFDFGTADSPVEIGYSQITENTLYTAELGYGWSSTSGLTSQDRGTPNNLQRDIVQSSTEHTFNVDLANGIYQIIITLGDQSYTHDLIDVYAENTIIIDGATTLAGSFQQILTHITIEDHQLNLKIADDGGTDENWVITDLVLHLANN